MDGVVWSESYIVSLYVKLGYIDLSTDSTAVRLDCTDAQADLELNCPQVTYGKWNLRHDKVQASNLISTSWT